MTKEKHILMIEDNEGDVLLAKEALSSGEVPMRISVAGDGVAGIEYLENQMRNPQPELPDLILLDINLPKKNGHEVLEFIKTHDSFKQIPVVMLSTSSLPEDITNSYANHANSFVTKPLELDNFLHVVSQVEHFWLHVVKLPSK
ncbi:response regulator [Chryseotalea sanaruensis]|uniref:Response regulator n=1 Tax=Chryseotalea sanaruensis TaxID=2482724 RepID=A0A401UEH4_9BACT|nr:response regulator [Chryseotalea sanaruensis]GCC53267.1 response regulator [Chryseotalea sanaruensis]